MSTKRSKLVINKIPLDHDIVYRKPNFPPFNELYLDLLENKSKLRKNPPKPIFVRTDPTPSPKRDRDTYDHHGSSNHDDTEDEIPDYESDNDYTLEDLERKYADNDVDDGDDSRAEKSGGDAPRAPATSAVSQSQPQAPQPMQQQTYSQQYFDQQQAEEEDEEEKERNEKADLLFKFMVLKKKYPNAEIPEFTEHSDFKTMKRIYNQLLGRIQLDSYVDWYRDLLSDGFMTTEALSMFLGFDIRGFAAYQKKRMNTYEVLLVELGEKNYSITGSRYPVELRLAFSILVGAVGFYVNKKVFGGGGDIFAGVGQTPVQNPQRRGGMRGPTITPDEIDGMTRNKHHGSETASDDEAS